MGAPDAQDHHQATADPWRQLPAPLRRDSPKRERFRRARPTLWVVAGMLVLIAGLVVAFTRSSSTSQGYAVTEGSVGVGVYLTLPVSVGPRTQLMQDDSPVWNYYPSLLPAGPADAYEAVGADYWAPRSDDRMVTLDVLFAKGDNGHRATFSVSPQGLVDLVTASMHIRGASRYPAGDSSTLLECGTYATSPMCVWADASTLCFLEFPGVPGTLDELAALAPDFERGLIRP